MRASDPTELAARLDRLRALLRAPEVVAERNEAHEWMLIEGFIPGREYALEGLMHYGRLHVLAIFDKPDPLDGPFFEETIYVTPSAATAEVQLAIVEGVARAADAIGLTHGPIHAECRVNDAGVFVLEVAARPIGGLCARAVRLQPIPTARGGPPPARAGRVAGGMEARGGRVGRDDDSDSAPGHAARRRRRGPGVRGSVRRGRPDHGQDPTSSWCRLPEGASYLGFIFARAHPAVGRRARAPRSARASSLHDWSGGPGDCLTGDALQFRTWLIVADPHLPVRDPAGKTTGRTGLLREVSEGAARARRAPVAGRARPACVRQRLGPGVEALGGSHEDDPQRVPPDAVAEGSSGSRRQADGRLLLRRRRRAPAWLRSPSRRSRRQTAAQIGNCGQSAIAI